MSTKEIKKIPVAVHKAAITLMVGETLHGFTRVLSTAGKDHVLKKLNLTKEKAYAWMAEAFGDYVVFDVDKRGDDTPAKYYAFSYKRDKEGNFEFGDTIEVERVTSFKPKSDMKITKEKKKKVIPGVGTKDPSKICPFCDKKYMGSPTKCPHCGKVLVEARAAKKNLEIDGWKETEKNIWKDIL